MRGAERGSSLGTVVAAFLAMGCGLVSLAGFEFILVPLQVDLRFSVDDANALIFMPAAASLLIVFLAGSLADRWGPRRPLMIATLLFTLGSVLVGLAPSLPWVILGRVLDGIGGVTMSIIALSVINTSVVDAGKRARLFGIYAAIAPAMFIVSPSLTALIVEQANWRAGVVPWVLLGAASLVATLRYIPSGGVAETGEWLTPMLAGLVLAGIALGILNASRHPMIGLVMTLIAAGSLVILVPAMRAARKPALDLRWCRGRGMLLLLVALAVASMPNMFFYTKLLLQYRYADPLLVIALLMAIPQACAIAGGLLSGPVSARFGPTRAAIGALGLSAVASLGTLLVSADAPIWVPVLALSISAAPIAFVVGPMTNVLLSRAPREASGVASSLRKATLTVGGVVGGAVIGYLSFNAFQARLTELLANGGVALDQAQSLAWEIRDGAVVDELLARSVDPIAREALMSRGPALLQAQSDTFMVMGVLSAVMYAVAALLMVLYYRRSGRSPEPARRVSTDRAAA